MASSSEECAGGSPVEMPSHGDLVKVLRESIDEVFSMMLISISKSAKESEDQATTDAASKDVDLEVGVEFAGPLCGRVLLRCSNQGAEDIARGLLMMETGDLDLEEVMDALGECANMVTGSLKSKALDPISTFSMGTPKVTAEVSKDRGHSNLVYQLARGLMSVELWLDDQEAQA